ncbi:MAG: MarR family transcriptional regulator [Planctomycetaceae bacterium]|nr:MarR family transcriptional regulator [Planctomycetaceae bacterium]
MPNATVTAAGMRLMKLLVGTPPQAVSELVRAAGVTRTAVAEQLDELVAAGLVERQTQRLSGRGRPRHLYRATNTAISLLFTGRQQLLVPAIWQAIRELGGEPLCGNVLKRVSGLLADHYRPNVTARKPVQRLQQLIGLLTAEGGLADAVQNDEGRVVLYKRSCPFLSMADPQRSVCHIDLEMISEVVGKPVRQVACRHEGDPCCAFEIVDD